VSPQNKPREAAHLVERVKAILASKKLTLHQVSQASEALYGKSSPFFLPHNLYYDLGLHTYTPSLHQLFALSRISNYRLADWMGVFGFDVGDVTRLQVLLPSNRTTLLDPSLDDPHSWVVWFRSKPGHFLLPNVVPLGQLLEYSSPRRIVSLSNIDSHSFLYAKLGRQDDFAFPDLLPASVVRVNPNLKPEPPFWANGKISDHFFLIEHSKGFCCCRIQPIGRNRIIPVSTQLPYAQVELRIPEEAAILGVVDSEIRPLLEPEQPEVPRDVARHWRPETLRQPERKLGQLLRDARMRMGLSFRDASALARQVADSLGDEQYFVSPGSLSDYEALDTPPRHIHKAISLCAIYRLEFSVFLKSAHFRLEEAGADFIPDQLLGRLPPAKPVSNGDAAEMEGEFLAALLKQWEGEIP
jgi:transcriptional regulator with XRE-family HTH domain